MQFDRVCKGMQCECVEGSKDRGSGGGKWSVGSGEWRVGGQYTSALEGWVAHVWQPQGARSSRSFRSSCASRISAAAIKKSVAKTRKWLRSQNYFYWVLLVGKHRRCSTIAVLHGVHNSRSLQLNRLRILIVGTPWNCAIRLCIPQTIECIRVLHY